MASVEEANSQVRRIAILVTSLDATAGRQLLMAMPSELARDVRRAMTRLTNVDPNEQRQILSEFRTQAITAPGGNKSSASGKSHSSNQATVGSATSVKPALSAANSTHHYQSEEAHAHNAAEGTSRGSDVGFDQSAYVSDSSSLSSSTGSSSGSSSQRPWQRLDVATLTKLLRGERATVIAVVISQLEPRQGAALLEQLPRTQHREVIASLTTLGQIDPEAMAAIDEYLASRISDYHHRDSAETETVGRMQQLLSAAPDSLRADWQEIIRDSDVQLAQRMGIQDRPLASPVELAAQSSGASLSTAATTASTAKSESTARRSAPAYQASRPPAGNTLIDLLANNVVTTADTQMPPATPDQEDDEPRVLPFPRVASTQTNGNGSKNSGASNKHTEKKHPDVVYDPRVQTASPVVKKHAVSSTPLARFEHILDLPAELIGQVLSEAETEIVLLALAGASPAFMQRFTTMLERQDARALRARIRELGPINLQDVDEAQRRMCELAIQVVEAAQQSLDAPTMAGRAA